MGVPGLLPELEVISTPIHPPAAGSKPGWERVIDASAHPLIPFMINALGVILNIVQLPTGSHNMGPDEDRGFLIRRHLPPKEALKPMLYELKGALLQSASRLL